MTKTEKFMLIERITYLHAPSKLVDLLGFDEGLRAADAILHNDDADWDLRYYAVAMLEALRRTFVEHWNASWTYDAYLGYAYIMCPDQEQRFFACSRALMKISPPPPQLLIEFADSYSGPGETFLTKQESISLVKNLLKTDLYEEAISHLISIYKFREDKSDYFYWMKIHAEVKDQIPPLPWIYELAEKKEKWVPSTDLLQQDAHFTE